MTAATHESSQGWLGSVGLGTSAFAGEDDDDDDDEDKNGVQIGRAAMVEDMEEVVALAAATSTSAETTRPQSSGSSREAEIGAGRGGEDGRNTDSNTEKGGNNSRDGGVENTRKNKVPPLGLYGVGFRLSMLLHRISLFATFCFMCIIRYGTSKYS